MAKASAKKTGKKKAIAKKKTAAAKKKPAGKKPVHPPGMHDAHEVVQERRYETRTLLSNVTFVALSFKTEGFGTANYAFTPDISGLLVDISHGGCSLIFMMANPRARNLVREVKCVVQLAPDKARLASVRWLKYLDGRLVNAGFAFG